MPKLYFYDTGLACSLLGIKKQEQLPIHFIYGSLFENFIINEFFKTTFNKGEAAEYYFWRDKSGKEIDLLVETGSHLFPIEIKAGKTSSKDFFKNLVYWSKLSENSAENNYVIYGGDKSFTLTLGNIISWKELDRILGRV